MKGKRKKIKVELSTVYESQTVILRLNEGFVITDKLNKVQTAFNKSDEVATKILYDLTEAFKPYVDTMAAGAEIVLYIQIAKPVNPEIKQAENEQEKTGA